MSLRTIAIGQSLPFAWRVSDDAVFQAGAFGQLTISGSSVCVKVSDGTCPLGIIDDVRSKAFSAVSWDEEVKVQNVEKALIGGQYVSTKEYKVELDNPNVFPESFVSIPLDVSLIPRNGVILFPQGTPVQVDDDGDGIPDAIRTFVRYSFQIPNIIGDDSTQGSGRVTIWWSSGIYQTDVFDTTASFPLNANLFINQKGLLTTKQYMERLPSIGIVTCPPNSTWAWLEFLKF